MKYKEGRFADILPSPKEQDLRIALHDDLYKTSLENTFQVLAPANNPSQNQWPTRIYLERSPQEVPIEIPRKAPWFFFQLLLSHYPADEANNLAGPALKFVIKGLDRILIPQEETTRRPKTGGGDLRNFTFPNTNPDPAAIGDRSAFRGALPFNKLLDSETTIDIIIFGFDGAKPAWVDLAIVGRMIKNRKILDSFF